MQSICPSCNIMTLVFDVACDITLPLPPMSKQSLTTSPGRTLHFVTPLSSNEVFLFRMTKTGGRMSHLDIKTR